MMYNVRESANVRPEIKVLADNTEIDGWGQARQGYQLAPTAHCAVKNREFVPPEPILR